MAGESGVGGSSRKESRTNGRKGKVPMSRWRHRAPLPAPPACIQQEEKKEERKKKQERIRGSLVLDTSETGFISFALRHVGSGDKISISVLIGHGLALVCLVMQLSAGRGVCAFPCPPGIGWATTSSVRLLMRLYILDWLSFPLSSSPSPVLPS